MVQIMDGAYDEVSSILQRMRDMAVQAANGSWFYEQGYLETEKDELVTALDAAINQAFGNIDLVKAPDSNGTSLSQSITIQAGANTGDATDKLGDCYCQQRFSSGIAGPYP